MPAPAYIPPIYPTYIPERPEHVPAILNALTGHVVRLTFTNGDTFTGYARPGRYGNTVATRPYRGRQWTYAGDAGCVAAITRLTRCRSCKRHFPGVDYATLCPACNV